MTTLKAGNNTNTYIKDKRISMYLFWFIAFLFSIISMTKNCFGSALAAIVSEGIMKKSQTGLISAAFYMAYGPLQPVGGILADKFNPKKLVSLGVAGAAIANTVIFFNHNYYVMLCAWFLNGVSQLALYPGLFKIISSQIAPVCRGKSIYYFSFTPSVGLALGYVVAMFVTEWEYIFLISAVLSFLLLFSFHIIYNKASKHMELDDTIKEEFVEDKEEERKENVSSFKLFLKSGFFILFPMWLIRYMVDTSIKAFTPTMMIENYENLNVFISNSFGVLVILSGILGMIVMRKIIFPLLKKNEVASVLVPLVIVLPLTFVTKGIGKIDAWIIVVAMCVISFLLTGAFLMSYFISGSFARYGKSGTAAGIATSASALGAVLQSYGVTAVADHYGWNTVTDLYIMGITICVVLVAIALPLWTKHKKQ